ncbi:MAG: IS630 transposase-related protein [Saezia sp.]
MTTPIVKKLKIGYNMRMAYSLDFRQKVLAIKKEQGLTYKQTAQRFDIGQTTLLRWHKRIEIHQCAVPRRRKIDKQALLEDVKQYPDAYQYERARRFGVSAVAIGKALKKQSISYKKNATPSIGL